MSHFSGKPLHDMGVESISNRSRNSLGVDDGNKSDFKELDLGAPGGFSTSSSSGSPDFPTPLAKRSNAILRAHSGEFVVSPAASVTAETGFRSVATARNSKPGHRRSSSTGAPLIYSGSSNSATSTTTSTSSSTAATNGGGSGGGPISVSSSPSTMLYPTGNICPSGKILKSNMGYRTSNKTDKLGSGAGNYGHGSIIKGGGGSGGGRVEANANGNIQIAGEMTAVKRVGSSSDPEEVKKAGNDLYKRGNFVEALALYDRAIALSPESAAYRSNRAAALTMLGRLGEAVKECEEAVRLDPEFVRAHERLASLYLRLGQVENARHHLSFLGQQLDKTELQKLELLEKHIKRCSEARKIGDWRMVLRECDAAMVAGAESSPQIVACKAEAFLKLQQFDDAERCMPDSPKLEPYPASCSQAKIFGILSEAYVLCIRAQIDMAFGRFDNAVAVAEKAGLIDYSNIEVAILLNNVKLVTRARARGKDLFSSGRFTEACSAYGEGLKYNLCNSVLYCNRAVCWSKLNLWSQSVEDSNQALKIQPKYTKALLLRAVSNTKLERWAEAVRDYEVLRRQLPGDNEVAESLSRAQLALKKSQWKEVHVGKSKEVQHGLDQPKTAISSAGENGEDQCSSKSCKHKKLFPPSTSTKLMAG